jgi:hypothetical protein
VNVLSTKVVLRERTLSEVLDLAFRFVMARGGRAYLRLWVLGCLPAYAVCCWLRYAGAPWEAVWAAALVGFVLTQVPFTLAASRLLLEDSVVLSNVARAWLRVVPSQLWSHAVATALLIGTGVVIVPLPFLAARLLFFPEITLLEGSGVVRALERGGRMTRARFGETLQSVTLLLVVWAFFILGAEATGHALWSELLGFPPPRDSVANGGSWFALFGFFLAVPVLATARFLFYIDSRTRREAWDVQLRFTELASESRGIG